VLTGDLASNTAEGKARTFKPSIKAILSRIQAIAPFAQAIVSSIQVIAVLVQTSCVSLDRSIESFPQAISSDLDVCEANTGCPRASGAFAGPFDLRSSS